MLKSRQKKRNNSCHIRQNIYTNKTNLRIHSSVAQWWSERLWENCSFPVKAGLKNWVNSGKPKCWKANGNPEPSPDNLGEGAETRPRGRTASIQWGGKRPIPDPEIDQEGNEIVRALWKHEEKTVTVRLLVRIQPEEPVWGLGQTFPFGLDPKLSTSMGASILS